jgi:8-amino-7-oxononanoate synthase
MSDGTKTIPGRAARRKRETPMKNEFFFAIVALAAPQRSPTVLDTILTADQQTGIAPEPTRDRYAAYAKTPKPMPKYAVESATASTARIQGREYIVFAGCNYLGLAHEPRVIEAAVLGLRRFGLSTSASRETTGNTQAHDELEHRLADLLGTEDCVVVPDGYTANLAACQALARSHTWAIIDERSHKSVHESAFAAGFQIVTFRHGDMDHAQLLAQLHADEGVVVMTDGVFTADGALAPLDRLVPMIETLGDRAHLLIDDCHGLGTLGPQGQGTLAHAHLRWSPRLVLTSTLAKGIGCHGGYVAGSRSLAQQIRQGSGAYVCVTPVSPALACGALESLTILTTEPQRLARLWANQARLASGLRSLGLSPACTPVPIFAFLVGTPERMLALHERLFERGVLAPYIKYPAGPAETFFRLSVSSEHSPEQIDALLDGFREELPR